ncbi:hypothetical protein EDD18DRAFT_1344201 [Armillaria luteobubalina]|uniref:CCHC-type domain-containing protein n=1 Tax=Armillaria luteobubalina TaxID=153913 RepID=A0AA39QLX8_9AGAR|nr:hypothetical protein EDD18DRAFT_1344201 [Armillaria luteobubalina]
MTPDTAEDPFTARPEPAQTITIRSIDEDLDDDDDEEMGVETEDTIQYDRNLNWSSVQSLEGTQALERAIDEALGCANRLKNDQQDISRTVIDKTRQLLSLLTGEPTYQHERMMKALEATRKTTERIEQAMADMKTTTAMEIREIGKQVLMSRAAAPIAQTPTSSNQTYAGVAKSARSNDATQRTTTPTNPMDPNHHSRLVFQFPGEKVHPLERKEAHILVKEVNAELAKHEDSKHIRVTTVKWNANDNIILTLRTDQKASDLLRFSGRIAPLLTRGKECIVQTTAKWGKLLIHGVRTGAYDYVIPGAKARNLPLELKPTWVRPESELLQQAYSSIKIATSDEEAYKFLIHKAKYLAAFGRTVSVKPFADRKPLPRCQNCQGFGHMRNNCQNETRCRLCGEKHPEERHKENCEGCKMEAQAAECTPEELPGDCDHKIQCANCTGKDGRDDAHTADSRRCPERILRLGEIRANVQQQKASDNGWKTAKGRRSRKRAMETHAPTKESTVHASLGTNSFQPLGTQVHIPGLGATNMEVTADNMDQSVTGTTIDNE